LNTGQKHVAIDIPTLVAISFMAWMLVNAIYKIIEYVGAAILVETPIQAISLTVISLDWDPVISGLKPGFVSAGGLWAILITGCLALIVLIQPRITNKPLRYFLWLFATFSFIVSANLFLATLIGVSDWAELTRNLEPNTIYKLIGISGGVLLVILGYIIPLRIWMPRLKGNYSAQIKVTLIPVLTLVAIQTLSVLASHHFKLPLSSNLLVTAVFGYPFFILWVILVNLIPVPRSRKPPESIQLQHSRRWLAIGAVTLATALATSTFFAIQLKLVQPYQAPPITSDGWNTASLREVGMGDEPINQLLRRLDQDDGHNIQSLLVVKNGKLVLEVYYPGVDMIVSDNLSFIRKDFDRDTLHCLASASKSITSILFGIAMDHGYFTELNEKMFANFPEYADLGKGDKGKITLRQMLTMTTGLQWDESSYNFNDKRNDLNLMFFSPNPVQFMLEKPLVTKPGNTFFYNSGSTNLIGEILNRKTGIPLVKFAGENLFAPLGITSYKWLTFPNAPQMAVTSSALYLRPRDMAKIGQLFLQEGVWDGKQIVSSQWVQESTVESVVQQISYPPAFRNTGYGYQWWRGKFANGETETIYAAGYGGQYIFILPDIDMVIVLTGSFFLEDYSYVLDVINTYILGSVYAYPAN
jgi:CubicO group peptidase (beta-lactamase class C family)